MVVNQLEVMICLSFKRRKLRSPQSCRPGLEAVVTSCWSFFEGNEQGGGLKIASVLEMTNSMIFENKMNSCVDLDFIELLKRSLVGIINMFFIFKIMFASKIK